MKKFEEFMGWGRLLFDVQRHLARQGFTQRAPRKASRAMPLEFMGYGEYARRARGDSGKG
jgi:hypothetical protein